MISNTEIAIISAEEQNGASVRQPCGVLRRVTLLCQCLREFELFVERGATEMLDSVYCLVRAVVLQSEFF